MTDVRESQEGATAEPSPAVETRRGFGGSAAVYLGSNVLQAAIPFFLLPVMTRVLSRNEYGMVGMFTTVVALLGGVAGLNTVGAIARRYYDRDSVDFPRYVTTCLGILAASCTIALAAVAIFAGSLEEFTGVPRFWLLMAVLAAAAQYLMTTRLTIWQVSGKPRSYGTFQVGYSALNVGLAVVLVVWLRWGADGRLWSQVLALLLFSLAGLWTLATSGVIRSKMSAAYARDALAFGVPLVPHVVGMYLIGSAGRYVINNRLGLDDVATYMVAVQLATVVSMITDGLNKAYVPWLFERLKNGSERDRVTIVRYTYLYFAAGLLAVAVVFAFARPAVVLIAGARYEASVAPLTWLVLGQVFGGMYLMVTNYLFYAGQTGSLAAITVAAGLVSIVGAMWLIGHFGVAGVAMSFAIAAALRFLLTWWRASRAVAMPWCNAVRGVSNNSGE